MGSLAHFDLVGLRRRHGLDVLVETGTYRGDGVALALAAGFSTVYSVELNAWLADAARRRFAGDPRVVVLTGASCDVMPEVLCRLAPGAHVLWWLDAHLPTLYGVTDPLAEMWPLEAELGLITRQRTCAADVFLIDDVRMYLPSIVYGAGPCPAEHRCPVSGVEFIYRLFTGTHDVVLDHADEGYAVCQPLAAAGAFARSAGEPLRPDQVADTNAFGLAVEGDEAREAGLWEAAELGEAAGLARLGRALLLQGHWQRAISACQLAAIEAPDDTTVRYGHVEALTTCGFYVPALRVLEAHPPAPGDVGGLLVRAQVRHQLCLVEEAMADYDAVLSANPGLPAAVSYHLVALNYRVEDQARLLAEARRYGELVGAPTNQPRPGAGTRRRVGILSPDLRRHSVTYFLRPLLARRPDGVELYTYYDNVHVDDVTEVIERQAVVARRVTGLTNQELERCLLEDQLDVVIDLAGHFGRDRLPVFARRVAPVQITGLGYPNTTGVPAMDWRLADPVADAGLAAHTTERQLVLSGGLWAYLPPDDLPEVTPPPRLPVLGYLGLLSKITPVVAAAWERARAASGATLLIKGDGLDDPRLRETWRRRLGGWGLDTDCLVLRGRTSGTREHLATYAEITVALDTWPYGGTTTTCEALMMGVPVVTLAGTRHASLVGKALLTGAGLPWVATSVDDYVQRVVGLAQDPVRLTRADVLGATWLQHEKVARGFWAAILSTLEAL